MMAANKQPVRGRRRPCEHCRRRHRRILATGTAGLLVLAGAITSAVELPGTNNIQVADAMALPYHATAIKSSAPATPEQNTERQIELIRSAAFRRAQAATPKPTTTVTHASTSVAHATVAATPVQSATHAAPTTPAPSPTPTEVATTASSAPVSGTDLGARVLAEAETMKGVPYIYGGDSPSGFDCSGLVYWASQQLGITGMPRDTYDMLGQGVSTGVLVQTNNPQPGDLAFFGSGHVEFYIGPGTTFGAQQPGTDVGFHSFSASYGYAPTAYYRIT